MLGEAKGLADAQASSHRDERRSPTTPCDGIFWKNNSWRLAACKTLGIPSLKVKKRQPKCPH